ncbi:Structural maintenance of chromosomes protein 5 [Tieghemiomyces parasiticus]|uniref:Structural maintenance of chromosomes protein 5 n=1 Tax=Tieghemiomyces parasiticus TaxID=78921 RepID=A0A9W8DXU6_9FUNG|nr:Structural maintenance of chromosomes protein 5 [Tieghemiomyces parasiticus]
MPSSKRTHDGGGGQKPSKRRQLAPDTDDETNEGSSQAPTFEASADRTNHPKVTAAVTTDNSTIGEFRPGSIVRVSLRQFVTYDACQFHPGPHLNMIIGPNGTGKSTIVCAIALGLGGNTSLLGRAKDISEFVKHGAERASIEIELKGFPGQRNVTVKRQIQRSSNSSTWKVDGRPATFKDVQTLVARFSVQVDNLCQFLPQDRVVAFAQMGPAELLRETQKAAGEAQLAEWHDTLIALRARQKVLTNALQTGTAEADNLAKRNTILERDVARFREREGILRQIQIIEARIPFARYAAAKEAFDATKEARRARHQAYKKLKKAQQPHEDRKQALDAEIQAAGRRKDRAAANRGTAGAEFETKMNEIEKLDAEANDQRNQLTALQHRDANRKKQMADLKREIEVLVQETAAGPPPGVGAPSEALTAETDAVNARLLELDRQLDDVRAQQNQIADLGRQAQGQIAAKHRELGALEDVRNQRLEQLRAFHADSYRAVLWLRENRARFTEHVFEPVCLEINLTDEMAGPMMETLIQSSTLKTFVCQTEHDYHLFTREVSDRQRLKVNVVMLTNRRLADFTAPLDADQMRDMGFERYALDLVDGPAPVLTALCDMDKLHATPISRGPVDNARVDGSRLLRQYVAQSTVFNIQYSRYGRRLPFVQTSPFRASRLLGRGTDLERKTQLENELDELRRSLTGNEARVKRLDQETTALKADQRNLLRDKERLTEQRREASQRLREFKQKEIKLETRKQQLRDLRKAPDRDRATEAAIHSQLHRLAVRRGRCVLQSRDALRTNVETHCQYTQALLAHLQATHRWAEADRQLAAFDAELQAAGDAYQEAEAQFQAAKSEAVEQLSQAERARAGLDEATWTAVQHYGQDLSLDDLEDALISERTKADLAHAGGSGANHAAVVQQYQARQAEIERLRATLSEQQAELDAIATELTTVRNHWEPRIAEIVARISTNFSEAFDRIGCAGEVALARHDDFDRWGVEIRVKFREHEKLQTLTGQRQSGGERSVSTILYLMALQKLAVAPFRVVDEINQGMDPRNERMVHHQLVEAACETLSAQYFLITPKLLPNLEYHPRMKVLCIYNGEWQPEKFAISSYIRNRSRG